MQKIIFSSLLCLLFFVPTSPYDELVMQANSYVQEKQYAAARTLYQKIIAQYPHNITLQYNYAYLLKQLGHMHMAASTYALVLKHKPDHAHAHIGYAQALLALGDFAQGYQELEWRNLTPDPAVDHIKNIIATRYRLDGLIFLLRAEWGMGDTLQMLRYAQILKERGATVHIALLHTALVPLCRMQPYFDHIIAPGDNIQPYHYAIPMISLPYVFATQPNSIPLTQNYLTVDTAHLDRWHTIMHTYRDTFNIGICWHGNTIHDPSKFMPLSYFARLGSLAHVRLFSLQKVHGLDDLTAIDPKITIHTFDNFDETHGAFIDTAALMHALDLVITVDTSIAHLAGAFNIPTWIILPKVADWRWMLNRTDTPWYGSITLFRQREDNDWEMVYHEIRHVLNTLLRNRNNQHNCI